jgi:predicted DNA-binding transcriptional regulator AlpA
MSENSTTLAVDINHPIFTLHHVAAFLHVGVDRARHYVARPDFPRPRRLTDGGGRHLWLRDDVLQWFMGLPLLPAPVVPDQRTAQPAQPVPQPVQHSTYRPRPRRAVSL